MKNNYKWLSLVLLMSLAGCQSVLDAPTASQTPIVAISHQDPQWQQHLAQLAKIQSYQTQGQFGYISGKDRFSSHFTWQYHSPTQFELTLSSNLSTKSLKLQRTATGMTVSDSDGRSRTETDVNALMEEMIGVSFPIDQFAYWVKGLPENDGNYVVNEKRQLAQFQYPIHGQLWKASYIEYHEDSKPNLPKLIVLENGQQTLKIRLDRWTY